MELIVRLSSFLHFLKFKLSDNSFTESFLCYVLYICLVQPSEVISKNLMLCCNVWKSDSIWGDACLIC